MKTKNIFRQVLGLIILFSAFSKTTKAQTPTWHWSKSYGATKDIITLDVDNNGNSVVAGSFSDSSITFGNITMTNNSAFNQSDIFIGRFDISGNPIWIKSFGASQNDIAKDITLDNNGNILVSGYFTSYNLQFDSISLSNPGGASKMFVCKLDSNGNVVWAKKNSLGNLMGWNIAVDGQNNVYVNGQLSGSTSIQFDTLLLSTTNGNSAFLVKYSEAGIPLWAKAANTNSNSQGLEIDNSNNVIINGSFYGGSFYFGNGTSVTTSFFNDIYLVKLDSSGNTIWTKTYGGSGFDVGREFDIDGNNNIYVPFSYQNNSIWFGTTSYANNGDYDSGLAKYDSAGNIIWVKVFGNNLADYCTNVKVNNNGTIFLLGCSASSPYQMGSYNLYTNGGLDSYVSQLDSLGNVQSVFNFGGNGDDVINNMELDPQGNIYFTGFHNSASITLGSNTFLNSNSNSTDYDIFTGKISMNITVGTESKEIESNLVISPNPTTSFLYISANIETKIKILNSLLHLVSEKRLIKGVNKINLSNLPSGNYFIKEENKFNSTHKITVIN